MSAASLRKAGQMDMLDMLAVPAAPAATQAAPGEPRRVQVEAGRVSYGGDIGETYCADTLSMGGKTRGTFTFEGAQWVKTAGLYGPQGDEAECYRIVPADSIEAAVAIKEAKAPGASPYGYHGREAKCAGKPVVLVGPKVVFFSPKKPEPIQEPQVPELVEGNGRGDERPHWKTRAYDWDGLILGSHDGSPPIEITVRGIPCVVSFGVTVCTHAIEPPGSLFWSDTGFRSFGWIRGGREEIIAAIEAHIDEPKSKGGLGGALVPWVGAEERIAAYRKANPQVFDDEPEAQPEPDLPADPAPAEPPAPAKRKARAAAPVEQPPVVEAQLPPEGAIARIEGAWHQWGKVGLGGTCYGWSRLRPHAHAAHALATPPRLNAKGEIVEPYPEPQAVEVEGHQVEVRWSEYGFAFHRQDGSHIAHVTGWATTAEEAVAVAREKGTIPLMFQWIDKPQVTP